MDIFTKARAKIQSNTDIYRHGKPAVLITALAILSLAALLICLPLFLFGILTNVGALIVLSVIVITALLLLGPRVFHDYGPALLRMVFGFLRGQPTIQHTGVWEGEKAEKAHFFDRQLCDELCKFLLEEKAESVVDFGCGMGRYVRAIREKAQIDCDGFDGNPSTPLLSQGICKVQNIATPFLLPKQYDFVLSLEVGEHLPKMCEEVFIDNLIAHAKKGIVVSWAKKGQGGHGHINEQDSGYIKSIFAKKGWKNDAVAEKRLSQASYPIYFWFYDTIMVFRKA